MTSRKIQQIKAIATTLAATNENGRVRADARHVRALCVEALEYAEIASIIRPVDARSREEKAYQAQMRDSIGTRADVRLMFVLELDVTETRIAAACMAERP